MNPRIRRTAHRVVEMLVLGQYADAERMSGGVRLSARALRRGVEACGGRLRHPPYQVFDAELDVAQVAGADPAAWRVACCLWTLERGRTPYRLRLRLTETHGTLLGIEISGIEGPGGP